MTKIDGATKHVRCSKLFAEIKKFYEANNSDSRLPKLVPGMLRAEQKGKLKSPKLRAKAGETRCLIPCQLLLAKKFLDASQPQEHTMILASEHLAAMYACLSAWDPEAFARSSQKFLLLLAALETNFLQSKMFRVKPKSHQIVELSRNGTNPICTWNYRDESFGHYLATRKATRWHFQFAGCGKQLLAQVLGSEPPASARGASVKRRISSCFACSEDFFVFYVCFNHTCLQMCFATD